LPDISGLHRPVIAPVSALHQFDADTVWRGDVTQAAAVDADFQLDHEADAFAAQLGAKSLEIALVEEAEMIGPPCVVTGKICKWPNGSRRSGVLARPLAADQDCHATQIDEDLPRPARCRIRRDRRAKHLDIPIGRCNLGKNSAVTVRFNTTQRNRDLRSCGKDVATTGVSRNSIHCDSHDLRAAADETKGCSRSKNAENRLGNSRPEWRVRSEDGAED